MKALRNAWYVAAWPDELDNGTLLGRTILSEPVVMFRDLEGVARAIGDRCPHRFAPLHRLFAPGQRDQRMRCSAATTALSSVQMASAAATRTATGWYRRPRRYPPTH